MQDVMLANISGTKEIYLQDKIEDLETNSKNNLFRGINSLKKRHVIRR